MQSFLFFFFFDGNAVFSWEGINAVLWLWISISKQLNIDYA